MKFIQEHPRLAALGGFIVLLASFLNDLLDLLQRFGGLQLPTLPDVVAQLARYVLLAIGLILLVTVYMQTRGASGKPTNSTRELLAGEIRPEGNLSLRIIPADSPEAKWKKAALYFLTWLYRRDEWPGLSREGRESESAPEFYFEERLRTLGVTDLPYERRTDVFPDPRWEPPVHALMAIGGTRVTCSCGWQGEGAPAWFKHIGASPAGGRDPFRRKKGKEATAAPNELTPESIYDKVAHMTDLQAKEATASWLGQTMTIRDKPLGIVNGDGRLTVTFRDQYPPNVWMYFDIRWKDRFLPLDQGDLISVSGRLDAVTKDSVSLADCELLD